VLIDVCLIDLVSARSLDHLIRSLKHADWNRRVDAMPRQIRSRRIQLNLRAPAFVKFVNRIAHDRRDLVEELPSKATSLQDMTTLLGIIFAAKVVHYS